MEASMHRANLVSENGHYHELCNGEGTLCMSHPTGLDSPSVRSDISAELLADFSLLQWRALTSLFERYVRHLQHM